MKIKFKRIKHNIDKWLLDYDVQVRLGLATSIIIAFTYVIGFVL